jgi:hypothetical protein
LRYCRSIFSHYYFSCNNYKELAQARITKVVGFFTTNPTKLVLHCSDFATMFYAIYKNQQKHLYYFSYNFAVRPLRRNTLLQCGPRGRGRRGPGQIPARAGIRDGRGRAWLGAGVARVGFGGSVGRGVAGGAGTPIGRRLWPPWLPVRRGGGSVGLVHGAASYG